MGTKLSGTALAVGLTCALLAGCGPEADDGKDTGAQQDTGDMADTGVGSDTADGGTTDSGTTDSGTTDGGTTDGGTTDGGDTTDGGEAIEIAGSWVSNFGDVFEIDAMGWGDNEVVEFDNEANTAILHVPEDAMFNADKYVRYDWTDPADGEFFYCQTVAMGLDSAEAVRMSDKSADASNPLEGGCNTSNDFPWTLMNEPFEISGTFTAPNDGSLEVTETKWGDQPMKDWNNEANWLVFQTPMDADMNAGKYNVLQYTDPAEDGSFSICRVAENLDSLKAAREADKQADPSELTSGCNGNSWARFTANNGG